jgi:propionyl-CoA carboxylase beta chain
VPQDHVITRKAYGGAYVVMNSKHLRADASFAWPSAEIAVMGSEGAVNVIFRRRSQESTDPADPAAADRRVRAAFSNPFVAAERGYVDDVIEPADTRPNPHQDPRMLRTKREQLPSRKHGNIPL